MSVNLNYIGEDIENMSKVELTTCDIPELTIEQVRSFRHILKFLNEKDRDIIYLVFVAGKKQRDIEKIINRSQPSLCYDIKRIRKRMKYIFYLQSVFDIFENFIVNDSKYLFTDENRQIMTYMFYTSSFTLTSKLMGISQVRVRYSYDKCLRKLKELEMWEVYEIISVIRNNLNIIRRVPPKNIKGKIQYPIGEPYYP